MQPLRASSLFSLVVLVTLGLYGLVLVVLFHPALIHGLHGHEIAGHVGQHFRLPHHRVHDLTFSYLLGTAAVGMLVQLRNPSKNVAGQWMALIPWVALALAFALAQTRIPFLPAPILGGLTLLAALLHPARGEVFRSFRVTRVSWVLLALVALAAIPLLAYASLKIGLQKTATDDHAALGHYGFMAAFSFTVIGLGLVTSLRPSGWRLTGWVTGLLPVLLGLASLAFPAADSGFSFVGKVAAIAWGAAFVAAAEVTRRLRRG